ncbi:hypothetical protein [Weissella hellenica]|nr:hypothetical protein [Weissella hellenica]NKY66495.1 hypothetical protein [Weissella hellenica]GED35330.1 hypothetical protein WHE01_02340 [Weissella hellenica]SCB83648.1 hypothetical protein GA0061075_103133 [Weissella hellenica]
MRTPTTQPTKRFYFIWGGLSVVAIVIGFVFIFMGANQKATQTEQQDHL